MTAAGRGGREPEDMTGDVYSPDQLAAAWGVCVRTIYRDIEKGALRAYRTPGGRLRIRGRDARRYGRPVDPR